MAMSPRLLRPIASRLALPADADARAYVLAVNAADGQPLEKPVVEAIGSFVTGCKADGIWDAIKASCILAGARTLAGALVPLKGAAPTNNNFVSGDYNRKTGLVGNGSNKSLTSNRNNNADPQNSKHLAVFVHTAHTSTASGAGSFPVYIGVGTSGTGASGLGRNNNNGADVFSRLNNAAANTISGAGSAVGLVGASRSLSASYVFRHGSGDTTVSRASQALFDAILGIYEDPSSNITQSNARLQFYSIGESINLALLESRLATLVAAIGAAIP